MSHRNAPLTMRGRLLLCRRIEAGTPIAHAAEAMSISRQCASKWWHRYLELGVEGLHDRSSRPRRSPTRTPARTEDKIVRERRRDKIGPDRIAARLDLRHPRSTGCCAVTTSTASVTSITRRRHPSAAMSAAAPASWCTST